MKNVNLKMSAKFILVLVCSALLGPVASSHADLLVYENFDYASSSLLTGESGGQGWGDSWALTGSTGGDTVMADGWSVDGVTSSGRAWRMDNYAGGTISRTLSQSVGIVGGTATHSEIWVSFMAVHAKDNFDYDFNLLDSTDTSRVHVMGPDDSGAVANTVRFDVQGASWNSEVSAIPTISYDYSEGPVFLLMKYGFAPGDLTTVDTWAFDIGDSIPQTEALLPSDSGHHNQFTGVADFYFDRLSFGGYSFDPAQIDEIRVATTLDDALHGTTVMIPEPSSLLVFSFGMGLLLMRRNFLAQT